jgi:O-6-methylguanine DNA methyltransferase
MRDFRRRRNKKGEEYGWNIAVYAKPEQLWGYRHVTSRYREQPEESRNHILAHMREIYPIATEKQVRKLIGWQDKYADAKSFDWTVDSPSKRIYEAVRQIPRGQVATYGQVAELAGDKKMARAVGNALHKNPDPEGIPCYRVVNAKGELSGEFAFGGSGAQAKLLAADGIEVVDGKVDLKRYGMKI